MLCTAFARGLDKEMGMSGTDAFASNWKVKLSSFVGAENLFFGNSDCVFNKIIGIRFAGLCVNSRKTHGINSLVDSINKYSDVLYYRFAAALFPFRLRTAV